MAERVLVAGTGGDAGVGAARALRDAGYEVVCTGAVPGPEAVVAAAVDEDVSAVVVVAAGPDTGLVAAVDAGLRQSGLDVPVLGGATPDAVVAAVRAAVPAPAGGAGSG